MFALAHDYIDKDLNVWADAYSLLADALRRPIFTETMMRGHMIADCGVLAIARGSGVRGNALPIEVHLYGACRDPCPEFLLQ